MSTPKGVQVVQTPLPGIGLRLEFVTAEGQRVGVVQRQQGDLDLFISHADDPDLAATSLSLTENEVATLTGLLGGSAFSHELSHLQEAAGGIAVDWLPIEARTRYAERRLGDTHLRAHTGVSVVAVIRKGSVIPSASPEFSFAAGDVFVAVGTAEGLAEAALILQSEP